jgi:hypothetical protein
MRSIIIVFSLAFTLLCQHTNAQDYQPSFSHTVGFTLYTAHQYTSFGLLYSPRLNFAQFSDNATFSLGTHLGLANSLDATSETNNSNTFDNYSIDVPIVVEYNFGNGASDESLNLFGFFIGGGYGFHNAEWKKIENSSLYNRSLHIRGPVINGGLRFTVGGMFPLGVRVGYMFNNSPGFNDVKGIGTAAIVVNLSTLL